MTAFLQFNKENIRYNKKPDFNQKFSSLFQELNPSVESFSIYFYSVYTARRLVFLIFQLFLDINYTIQFSAHVAGSILCLIYYLKFTHLKEKSSKMILIASEITILITFLCVFMINFTKSKYLQDCITTIVMISVIGFIAFQGLIEIYKLFVFLKDLLNHFKKKRRAKADIVIILDNSNK